MGAWGRPRAADGRIHVTGSDPIIKQVLRAAFKRLGYDITAHNHFHSHECRRQKFFRDYDITLVIDVGANEGQHARRLRNQGYTGRLVSFEPLSQAFETLQRNSSADPHWQVRREALGDCEQEADLNVAPASDVSSILAATGVSETQDWKGRLTERITVRRLDSIFDSIAGRGDHVYLKLDVQGYEKHVLLGAEQVLSRIDLVEMEMSVEELYSGESLMPELLQLMAAYGYRLASLKDVYVARNGCVLQYDGIFLRFLDGVY